MIWVETGGVNRAGVRTGNGGTRTLTLGDLEAIKARVPLVENVTPQADTSVQVIHGNQNWRASVRGVGVQHGRWIELCGATGWHRRAEDTHGNECSAGAPATARFANVLFLSPSTA